MLVVCAVALAVTAVTHRTQTVVRQPMPPAPRPDGRAGASQGARVAAGAMSNRRRASVDRGTLDKWEAPMREDDTGRP